MHAGTKNRSLIERLKNLSLKVKNSMDMLYTWGTLRFFLCMRTSAQCKRKNKIQKSIWTNQDSAGVKNDDDTSIIKASY